MTKNYLPKQGQSIVDVCLQVYGSLDNLFSLIQNNGLIGIEVDPDSLLNKNIVYDDALTINPSIFNQSVNQKTIYATSNKFSLEGVIADDAGIPIGDDGGGFIGQD